MSVELYGFFRVSALSVSDTWSEHNGKSYKVFGEIKILSDAYQICQENGAQLPEPNNKEEMEFLASLTGNMFYFGMMFERNKEDLTWYWLSDRAPVTFFNWDVAGQCWVILYSKLVTYTLLERAITLLNILPRNSLLYSNITQECQKNSS